MPGSKKNRGNDSGAGAMLIKKRMTKYLVHLFIGAVALVTVTLLINSLSLRAKSAVLPVSLCISILFLLCADLVVRLSARKRPSLRETVPETSDPLPGGGRVGVTVWLFFSMAVTYLFGFLVAIFVCTSLYFRLFCERRFFNSVLMSVVFTCLIYIGFVVFAKFELYRGVLLM